MTQEGTPQDNQDSQRGPTVPSREQLAAGYEVGPEELVAIDLQDVDISGRRVYPCVVEGRDAVHVPIGSLETRNRTVIGLISRLEYLSEGTRFSNFGLVLNGESETILPLAADWPWGIGRRFEGQQGLNRYVSADHCAVSLDSKGRFQLENHNPTNGTVVLVHARNY